LSFLADKAVAIQISVSEPTYFGLATGAIDE